MWKVALGLVVLLQAAAPRAGQEQSDTSDETESAGESAGTDRSSDESVVPTAAPAEAAAPAATAAPAALKPVAFATVSFRNDVGKKLRLVEAYFTLDGEKLPVVLTSAEPGKSFVIVSGAVKPGQHVVAAHLTYRGDRGVFSYMKGYRLNVRSAQMLNAPSDRAVNFTVVGSENKGLTVPLDKRVVVTLENGAGTR